MQSFGLNPQGLARLFAAVSFSAIGAFVLTRMFDSFGRGRVLRLCVLAAAASAIGAACSPTLAPFVIFDVALGACASAIIAGTPVIIAEVLSPDERATGQGLGGIALGAGAGLCIILMPALHHLNWSWRWLLWAAGAPILAGPWLLSSRWDSQFWHPEHSRESLLALGGLFNGAHRRRIAVLMASSVCSTAAISASRTWGYFHSVKEAGLTPFVASAIFLFAGAVAMAGFPLGALCSDRAGRVPTVAASAAVIAAMAMVSFWGPPASFRYPALWLGAGFAVLSVAVNVATVGGTAAATELFPAPMRATAVGWIALAGAGGTVAGQALIALLAAHFRQVSTVVGITGLLALGTSALFMLFVEESRGLVLKMDPQW